MTDSPQPDPATSRDEAMSEPPNTARQREAEQAAAHPPRIRVRPDPIQQAITWAVVALFVAAAIIFAISLINQNSEVPTGQPAKQALA